jgi:hypothetical protein
MDWVFAIAALSGVAGGLAGLRKHTSRRRQIKDDAVELAGVRDMAEEDTTLFGEQLTRLGLDHRTDAMDEATRSEYQSALDAYESAKSAVPRLTRLDEISTIVDVLSTGRYALACVQARLDGRPVPERRVPCYFNPQHGPSAKDVQWTDARRGTHLVPACAQDAARVANGELPDIRKVRFGSTLQPYWDAGAAHLPYGKNYYSTAMLQVGHQHTTDGGAGLGGSH